MQMELERILETVYTICDGCDEMPINLAGKEINKKTREVLKLDILCFAMYLSASDGHINHAEARFLSKFLRIPVKEEQIADTIREANIYSTEFEQRPPLSLQRLLQADNLLISRGVDVNRYSSECLIDLFSAIGYEIINSDNDAAMNEKADFNIYIGMMKNYVEKNLHTGIQKAAPAQNTLKSQYQILKKK